MTDVVETRPAALAPNPFGRALDSSANAGTVEIESSRAAAEVQAKVVAAKRFPRSQAESYDRLIKACLRPTLAEKATYAFPRGDDTISGPSIRLAEEAARCWGNIIYGIRELSQKDGVSEMQAFAWDLESNVESVQNFTVKHERHTKKGSYALTDPRDIYELTANQAGRRLRARILAVLPPDYIEGALEQCQATLEAEAQKDAALYLRKMVAAFGRPGVTPEQLAAKIGCELEKATPAQLETLRGIYQSVRDNMSSVGEWFSGAGGDQAQQSAASDAIMAQAQKGAAKAAGGDASKTNEGGGNGKA